MNLHNLVSAPPPWLRLVKEFLEARNAGVYWEFVGDTHLRYSFDDDNPRLWSTYTQSACLADLDRANVWDQNGRPNR